jgi:hypothetical protein
VATRTATPRELLADLQQALRTRSGSAGTLPGRVILVLFLILLPAVWLAAAVFAVAACRSAARADRIEARQRGRLPDDPSALPGSEAARGYGLAVSQGV